MQPPPADAAPAAEAPARPARASRIAYQPALDGLRALAILTIMLYHGQVSWPRGGYLSVDLFFVLWPLVLIVGLRLARGRLRPVLVGTLLALCASALTMAALYRPGVDPSRLYYGTDTRAQALLFGGALAVVLAMWDHRPLPRAL